jgi:hypothetical protein
MAACPTGVHAARFMMQPLLLIVPRPARSPIAEFV